MRGSQFMCLLCVCGVMIALAAKPVLGNGKTSKWHRYDGKTQLGQKSWEVCSFSTQVHSVLFHLNSVQDKYKVVYIRIRNESDSDLRLSKQEDKVELLFDDRSPIPGILDLFKHDPARWDMLDGGLREMLLYPNVVEAGEEETIYIFIDKSEINQLPQVFRYSIQSLPEKQIDIKDVTAVAAH